MHLSRTGNSVLSGVVVSLLGFTALLTTQALGQEDGGVDPQGRHIEDSSQPHRTPEEARRLFTTNLREEYLWARNNARSEGPLALEAFNFSNSYLGNENYVAQLRSLLEQSFANVSERSSSVFLLGEAGVGKTELVNELARRHSFTILELKVEDLLSGTKYRGSLEEKFIQLINGVTDRPGRILFIDEAHRLFGIEGFWDRLKPLLGSGKLRAVFGTTRYEFNKYFGEDPAVTRRGVTMEMASPDVKTVVDRIRFRNRPGPDGQQMIRRFYGVNVTDRAIVEAVRLAEKNFPGESLMSRADQVLMAAVRRMRDQLLYGNGERANLETERNTIEAEILSKQEELRLHTDPGHNGAPRDEFRISELDAELKELRVKLDALNVEIANHAQGDLRPGPKQMLDAAVDLEMETERARHERSREYRRFETQAKTLREQILKENSRALSALDTADKLAQDRLVFEVAEQGGQTPETRQARDTLSRSGKAYEKALGALEGDLRKQVERYFELKTRMASAQRAYQLSNIALTTLQNETLPSLRQQMGDWLKGQNAQTVDAVHIRAAVAELKGRTTTTEVSALERVDNMGREVRRHVKGQDSAISAIENVMRGRAANIDVDPERPLLVGLFGPSGVGKTFLVEQIARALGLPFKTFAGGSYQAGESLWTLLGSGRGFKDSDRGGEMTEWVRANPEGILFLDEFTAFFRRIQEALLPAFDKGGSITDTFGRNTSFRHNIVFVGGNNIMDWSAEKHAISERILIHPEIIETLPRVLSQKYQVDEEQIRRILTNENNTIDERIAEMDSVVARKILTSPPTGLNSMGGNFFSQPFANRFDVVITMGPLTQQMAKDIADYQLNEQKKALARQKQVTYTYTERATEALARLVVAEAQDGGARTIGRMRQRIINERMLIVAARNGALTPGAQINLDFVPNADNSGGEFVLTRKGDAQPLVSVRRNFPAVAPDALTVLLNPMRAGVGEEMRRPVPEPGNADEPRINIPGLRDAVQNILGRKR